MPRPVGIEMVTGSSLPSPTSSVLDVAGAVLGHLTVVRDEPAPPERRRGCAHRAGGRMSTASRVVVHPTMQVEGGRERTDVTSDLERYDGQEQVSQRQWTGRFPR